MNKGEEVLKAVSTAFGVSKECIVAKSKRPEHVHPRYAAMYLMRALGLSNNSFLKHFDIKGLGYSMVSAAIKRANELNSSDAYFRSQVGIAKTVLEGIFGSFEVKPPKKRRPPTRKPSPGKPIDLTPHEWRESKPRQSPSK